MDLYCLSNFIDYSESIETPLKHTTRIKYTCFDISANYLIFGATSGSLYVFTRRTCKFLHLIPTKHGVVTQLAISPNEKYVAFATQRATICVYAVNLSATTAPHIIYTQLSNGLQVTCIQWKKQDEKQFYYGDTKGQVNLVLLSSFIGRSLLTMTAHPLLFLDSPIVQIDDFESLLLVSNITKCILCNTEYEEYKQIGNRPREGAFGATFAISSNEIKQPSRIYCARPGSRVWEVDFEGDVIQTHQFKKSLAIPPVRIYTLSEPKCGGLSNADCSDFGEENVLDYQPQTLQFWKLQMLRTNFLLAFTEMALYIFDMRTSSVVLWCNQFERILDARVVGEEIFVFTKTGSLYSVHMSTVQSYALNLVFQEKLLECACLMRKHVKYFADQAHENYELKVLNHIKNFLIDRLEYELLNDLSVIFDAIAQCEGNTDNNSSCGSSATAEKCSSGGGKNGSSYCNKRDPSIYPQREPNELYVLENSFCDNLKPLRGDKHIKDSLLTVTGKFGKNIIKYKFNIFADEQRKLVNDLLPPNERNMPFKDVNADYEQDVEIVCRTPVKKSREALLTIESRKTKLTSHTLQQISAEEKTMYNLYLICKSAKMSNTNCVDRYRAVFDEYTAPELVELLKKLELVMLDQGESPDTAKKSCYEMYFNYLNPDLIFEMDNNTRNYITEGFIMLNATDNIVRCDNCAFPLRFDNSCSFHELGSVLLRYFWSRNEQIKCFDVLMQVPALLDVLAKFYMTENNLHKVLAVIMNYGQPNLLMDLGKSFNVAAWARCFEQFVQLQQGKLTCINCDCIIEVENVNRHFFYTWNCFLDIILEHLPTQEILLLIFKWSNFISNDAIDREFYANCLLKE